MKCSEWGQSDFNSLVLLKSGRPPRASGRQRNRKRRRSPTDVGTEDSGQEAQVADTVPQCRERDRKRRRREKGKVPGNTNVTWVGLVGLIGRTVPELNWTF